MNSAFFQQIEIILHQERLDSYRQDKAGATVTLARYLLNMALSESLYPVLQLAEIALRNSIHAALTSRCSTPAWYDVIHGLPSWQMDKIQSARDSLIKNRKPITPGRMVAELNFGFWTGFFHNSQARSGIGHYLARSVFPHAPKSGRVLSTLDLHWKRIRDLRNRVFHHERIIHWKDLDEQHAAILEAIGWISPELHKVVGVLDRFTALRREGLDPWLAKIRHRWPEQTDTPAIAPANLAVAIIPDSFDATNGAETPFGHRWGGDVFPLSTEHLAALQAGQTLALDVQNEYITFLKAAESAQLEQAIQANLRGLGYGG